MADKTPTGYGPLLKDAAFEAFLWTQFLGAFNDNVFKMIVSVFAVSAASGANISSRNLALAGAVFVLPFLLFAGYSGQLTDRFSKTRVLQITKSFEIATMLLALAALSAGRIEYLLVVLFLLATQANFFSPAKYGILPEMLPEAQLSRANGLLELTTFVAIVIGASFGTFLFSSTGATTPLRMGLARASPSPWSAPLAQPRASESATRQAPASPFPTGKPLSRNRRRRAGPQRAKTARRLSVVRNLLVVLVRRRHLFQLALLLLAPKFSMSTKPKWDCSSPRLPRASDSAASVPAPFPATT